MRQEYRDVERSANSTARSIPSIHLDHINDVAIDASVCSDNDDSDESDDDEESSDDSTDPEQVTVPLTICVMIMVG